MLDKLPAWARHAVIVFGGAFASVVVGAIITAKGVTNIDWAVTAMDALNYGALATALSISALYITPLTRQYGVGDKQ